MSYKEFAEKVATLHLMFINKEIDEARLEYLVDNLLMDMGYNPWASHM